MNITKIDRFRGCLLGGACGDALGYPVEFMQIEEIKRKYGRNGIRTLKRNAHFSDDTQMTLFTANAVLHTTHAEDVNAYWAEYQRWLFTQIGYSANNIYLPRRKDEKAPYILDQRELYAQRAPGNTCINALMGGVPGTVARRLNDSKGCGGIMRVAPCGLRFWNTPRVAFDAGVTAAATTHGHSTGFVAAGAFAAIIATVIREQVSSPGTLRLAVRRIADMLPVWCPKGVDFHETISAMQNAFDLSVYGDDPHTVNTVLLGEGWTAETALAIALYSAYSTTNPTDAICCAVNHSGDSDSTGAICGNLVGAMYGASALPKDWASHVELSDYICQTADALREAKATL